MAAHVTLQHSSMQYSDSDHNQAHDARAVFTLDSDLITGTEASQGTTLFERLPVAGHAAGYFTLVHPYGEWLAVARGFGRVTHHGYVHVLDGMPGAAAEGGHQPRGILWATIVPTMHFGAVTIGVAHWVTRADEEREHVNAKLERAIGRFAVEHGSGRDLCFVSGDANQDDARTNVFGGNAPLTTCWDELGKWPSTHGANGGTIDIIASYNHDRRVACQSAHAYTDKELPLFTDHQTIRATYAVKV